MLVEQLLPIKTLSKLYKLKIKVKTYIYIYIIWVVPIFCFYFFFLNKFLVFKKIILFWSKFV